MIPAAFVPEPKPSLTPLLDECLTFVLDSMKTAKCPEKQKALDLIAASLRDKQRYSDDLTESCERDYYVRIARVLQQPDTQPVEAPEVFTEYDLGEAPKPEPLTPFARMSEVPNGETWDGEPEA